jgi:hypothetical protein
VFCAVHDPKNMKLRRDRSEQLWENKHRAFQAPWLALEKARRRIRRLERLVRRLGGQVPPERK